MTPDELAELLDLSLDDALPEALRARFEAHVTAHPDAARDLASLQRTVARLRAVPPERPGEWSVERTLDALLREHADAPGAAMAASPE